MDRITIIHSWMISEFQLQGNELLIFAAIYGATSGGGYFTSGSKALESSSGASRRSVFYALNSLVEKGLLKRVPVFVNGHHVYAYASTVYVEENEPDLIPDSDIEDSCMSATVAPSAKTAPSAIKKVPPHTPSLRMSVNNDIDCKRNVDCSPSPYSPPPPQKKGGIRRDIEEQIHSFCNGDALLEENLLAWEENRRIRKKPLTMRALTMNLSRIKPFAEQSRLSPADYVGEIVVRGWLVFYVISEDKESKDDIFGQLLAEEKARIGI